MGLFSRFYILAAAEHPDLLFWSKCRAGRACYINHAIPVSVATPAAALIAALPAATITAAANADTGAGADRRACRLVHLARRRTAVDHDVIVGFAIARRLAIGALRR